MGTTFLHLVKFSAMILFNIRSMLLIWYLSLSMLTIWRFGFCLVFPSFCIFLSCAFKNVLYSLFLWSNSSIFIFNFLYLIFYLINSTCKISPETSKWLLNLSILSSFQLMSSIILFLCWIQFSNPLSSSAFYIVMCSCFLGFHSVV